MLESLRLEWMRDAACANVTYEGPDPFFNHYEAKVDARTEWCLNCPVAWECLQVGVGTEGVWGGMNEAERNRFFAKHRPGARTTRAWADWQKHRRELDKKARGKRALEAYEAARAAKKKPA